MAFIPGTADAPQNRPGVDPSRAALVDGIESIDLFSGQVNLSYTDVCIPGQFGLDMCVTRSYSSAVVDEAGTAQNDDSWAGKGWTINPGGRLRMEEIGMDHLWLQLPGRGVEKGWRVDSSFPEFYRTGTDADAFPDQSTTDLDLYITSEFSFVYRDAEGDYRAITTDGVGYEFDASTHSDGWMYGVRIYNANGDEITLDYGSTSPAGGLSTMTDAASRTITFVRDSAGYLDYISVAGVGGGTVTYQYDITGGLLNTYSAPTGETTTYAYNTAGYDEIERITWPSGGTTDYVFTLRSYLHDGSGSGSGCVVQTGQAIALTSKETDDTLHTWTWDYVYDDYATSAFDDASMLRKTDVLLPDGGAIHHYFLSTNFECSTGGGTVTSMMSGRPYATVTSDPTGTDVAETYYDYSDLGGGWSGWNVIPLSNEDDDPFSAFAFPVMLPVARSVTNYDYPTACSDDTCGVRSQEVFGDVSEGEYDEFGNPLQRIVSMHDPYFAGTPDFTRADETCTEYAWSTDTAIAGWNLTRLPSLVVTGLTDTVTSTGTYDSGEGLPTCLNRADSSVVFYTASQVETTYDNIHVGWPDTVTSLATPNAGTYTNGSDDEVLEFSYLGASGPCDEVIRIDHGGLREEEQCAQYGQVRWHKWLVGSVLVTDWSSTIDSNRGVITATTDSAGSTTSYLYDDSARLVTIDSPLDADSTYIWDVAGSTPTLSVTKGATTSTWTYDGLGRVIAAEASNGSGGDAVVEKELDYNGRETTAYLPRSTTGSSTGYTTTTYDVLGRPTEVTRTDGTTTYTTSTVWSANTSGEFTTQRATITDPNGNVTVRDLNGLEALALVTPPTGAITETTRFDQGAGQRTDVWNSASTESVSQIRITDGAGRPVAVVDDSAGTYTWQRNAAGDVVCETDGAGRTIVRAYDESGRPTRIDNETSCTAVDPAEVLYYYDGAKPPAAPAGFPTTFTGGRLTGISDTTGWEQRSYDAMGRLSKARVSLNGYAFKYDLDYAYDTEGNIDSVTLTWGNGSRTMETSTTWAAGSRPEVVDLIADGSTIPIVTSASWHPQGLADLVAFANGVDQHVELDDFGRVERVYMFGSDDDLDETYGYDGLDNLTSVTVGSTTDLWTYDEANRLDAVAYDSTTDITYTWDEFGNLEARTSSTYPDLDYGGHTFTQNRDDAYTYDAAGNVTDNGPITMTWDVNGQMQTSAAGPESATIKYNHMQQRVSRKVLNSSGPGLELHELFVYDHMGRLLAVFRKPTPLVNATLHAFYVYAGNHPVAVRRDLPSAAGETSFLHTDLLGSVRRVTDASGNVRQSTEYHPHGKVRSETGVYPVDEIAYGGHDAFDEFHLADWGARTLGSGQPSFLSPDRVALGTAEDPQSFNRYMYALGRPGNMVDPGGDNPVAVAGTGGAVVAVGGYLTLEGAFTVTDVFVLAADGYAWYTGDGTAAAFAASAGGLAMGVVTPGPGTAYTKVGSVLGKTGFARYGDLVYVYMTADMKLAETVKAQLHHVMTVKRNVSEYTARFRAVASRYGLDLEGLFNKMELPHSGGHTVKYTNWVRDEVEAIDKVAGDDPEVFLREFRDRIVIPLLRDPNRAYMK